MNESKLNILMLTWEFPPRIIGGISSHVSDLSLALTRKGLTVHVVTCDFPGAPEYEEIQGVNVYRFNSKIPSYSFLSWVFSMNQNMAETAIEVIKAYNERIDVIHAHDWLVAVAALKVRETYQKPLVTTMHATEAGRRGGIHNEYQRTINNVESQLINQSSVVVCCSKYMEKQISDTFNVPKEKLRTIPNGVDASKFNGKRNAKGAMETRNRPADKTVLYVGRLVQEKGVHVLLGAAPKILNVLPNVSFAVVGEGGMKEQLAKEAWDFGIADRVRFMGFMDEKALLSLYKASDIAVVPSLYEPFGITALEAMAAKIPLVVSDTGGLAEIVEHGETGVKVYPDNSDSLAWGVLKVLQDRAFANKIRQNAYQKAIRDYNWSKIGDETIQVYHQALMKSPRQDLKLTIDAPTLKLDTFQQEFRILVMMHVLGAASNQNARSAEELAEIFKMTRERIRRILQQLIELGYVQAFVNRFGRLQYFLTRSGIIKACSLFS